VVTEALCGDSGSFVEGFGIDFYRVPESVQVFEGHDALLDGHGQSIACSPCVRLYWKARFTGMTPADVPDRKILETLQRLSKGPDDCVSASLICEELGFGDPPEVKWRFVLLEKEQMLKIFGENLLGGFSARLEPLGKLRLSKPEINADRVQAMPTDATLTRIQKNAILPILIKHHLNPADFKWEQFVTTEPKLFADGAGWSNAKFLASKVIHSPTGYYFVFGAYITIRNPGTTRKHAEDPHKNNWQTKLENFETWLLKLSEEIEAPDLWASVGQERALANAASSAETDNNPLNQQEQELASESLKEIRSKLLSMEQFNERQAAIIDGQFKYLGEAVGRVGRKDLLLLTFGSLVTIIVALSLTQEQGNTLLRLAGVLLHQLWDGGMLTLGQ